LSSESKAAAGLEPELKRYLEKTIREGKRNGLHLPQEIRNSVVTIKKRMSELVVSFEKNLNEDTTHLFFERAELEGVPEDLINSLGRNRQGGQF
jgi:Zn-dependent oligopeptidase